MVSVAEGLRMLQGGVDRTGFADMADSLGNPGMDLIAARRAAAAEAEAIAEYERKQAERDAEFRDELDKIIQNRGDETGTDLDINDTAMSKFGGASLLPLLLGKPGVPATALGLGALGVYDKFTNQIPMIDERLQEADPEGFQEMMEDPGEAFLYNVRPMFSQADGGRVDLFQGGPSQQGQTQRGGLQGGRRGFGGPPGGGGGNQKSQKEVDIDQLKKEEEEKAKMVTTKTTLNPALYGLVEDQLSLQTPPEPMQEQSFLDTVSKYNPLQQDFQVTPNLSFGYDVNPNLKDLSDINATAGFSYSFNQGGPVSVGMDDNKRTLRISEDDRFIEAEQMSTGDTELYNYLVGGEIMPGLSFELGVMDDAVMEPGMRSPDDLKFFNIKKTF